MKKVLLVILLAMSSAVTIVSCTEEQVAPSTAPPIGGSGEPGKI